jgi:hypothetical protein
LAAARKYPDPKVCKIKHIPARLYECLSRDVSNCPYAFKVGWSFYCDHPDCPNFKEVSEDKLNKIDKYK